MAIVAVLAVGLFIKVIIDNNKDPVVAVDIEPADRDKNNELGRTSVSSRDVSREILSRVADKIGEATNPYPEFPLDTPDRKEWIRNFPFEPTYSSDNPFDPKKYNYDENDPFARDMEHVERVFRHGFMRYFYENPSHYSRPFEEIYRIMESEGLGHNPMAIAKIFNDMLMYHQARQQDPDKIWRTRDPDFDLITMPDGTQRVGIVEKTKTYNDFANDLHDMVIGKFLDGTNWQDLEMVSEERATQIRDRLFQEVDGAGFTEAPWHDFSYNTDYEEELQSGDPMMVR